MIYNNKKHNFAFVSDLFPEYMEKGLLQFANQIIRLPRSKFISSEVGTHPDILLCDTTDGTFIGSPSLKTSLSQYCFFIAGSEPDDGYPGEVLYNCLFTKKHLFSSKYSDKTLFEYAESTDREAVFVKQGYTKCSVAVCGDFNFITADNGIYNALVKYGYNVLKIKSDGIRLNGYSYGFIGGCSSYVGNGKMLFTGRIESIPDGSSIKDFLRNIGLEYISIGNDELYDYGGIIFV